MEILDYDICSTWRRKWPSMATPQPNHRENTKCTHNQHYIYLHNKTPKHRQCKNSANRSTSAKKHAKERLKKLLYESKHRARVAIRNINSPSIHGLSFQIDIMSMVGVIAKDEECLEIICRSQTIQHGALYCRALLL